MAKTVLVVCPITDEGEKRMDEEKTGLKIRDKGGSQVDYLDIQSKNSARDLPLQPATFALNFWFCALVPGAIIGVFRTFIQPL